MTVSTVGDYYTYTLEPAAPASMQPVFVRTVSPDGCILVDVVAQADVEARTIQVFSLFDDGVPPQCPVGSESPQLFPIGAFPRGTYTVSYVSCVSNPLPGNPPCMEFATEVMSVGGGEPTAVPALDVGGLGLLCVAVLLAARRVAT